MKKVLAILIIISIFFNINVLSKSNKISFKRVNTLNFTNVIRSEEIYYRIKKICSYNFCDYAVGENIKDKLSNFEESYLKTIGDVDIKNELKIKGIRITSVYLN